LRLLLRDCLIPTTGTAAGLGVADQGIRVRPSMFAVSNLGLGNKKESDGLAGKGLCGAIAVHHGAKSGSNLRAASHGTAFSFNSQRDKSGKVRRAAARSKSWKNE